MRQPTFLLKPSAYKANKLYSILPDDGGGDFTVSSYVGNGTRVNSDGLIETVASDTPRLDYLNGCGLLLEPTRTNIMTYTAAVTGWSGTTVTADDEIAPDGTKTAVRLEDDAGGTAEFTQKTATISASTQYTFSIFIKFGTTDRVHLVLATTAGTTASTTHYFNSDGTYTTFQDASGIVDGGGSEYYGDGWYRFYTTFTSLTGNTGVTLTMYPSYGAFDIEPQGYCWFWGNQLEAGGFMTSLIPTVASGLQRLYDNLVTPDLITAGLLTASNAFVVVKLQDLLTETRDGAGRIFDFGSTNGAVYIYNNGTNTTAVVVSTDTTSTATALTGTSHNVGFNISWDNVDVWVDGVKTTTTSKEIYLTGGVLELEGSGISSKLKEIAIYNNTVSDAEAKRLTS